MKKRIYCLFLSAVMTLSLLSGCGTKESSANTTKAESGTIVNNNGSSGTSTGTLNAATAFWYELDAHKDYNGWYSSMYGITETLFKVGDDYSTTPWIAESGECEGNTWTIKLNNNVVFSNGNPVTASVVITNLKRAGELNERAILLATATMEEIDSTTFTLTTSEPYPTLLSDLTEPYTSIMDIENIPEDDYNNNIVGTGPFKISSYSAEDKIELVKNEKYWDGSVALDGANIFYIPDSSTQAMSLQNNEIDVYVGPDSDSIALFSSDSNFKLSSVASTKAYYYLFNIEKLTNPTIREAIMTGINKADIATLLSGLVNVTEGAYGPDTALGAVTSPSYDPAAARTLLEKAGYSLNENNFYEKDGQELSITLAYYASRSIDKITTLIQDELKAVGINAVLQLYEDPDATYMKSGDFDMAMYISSTTTSGDAYAFLNATLSSTGNKNGGNYTSTDVDSMLSQLAIETDSQKRIELSLAIQQKVINDYAIGYYAMTNKITVSKATVSNCSETNPLTFYFLTKDSSIQ